MNARGNKFEQDDTIDVNMMVSGLSECTKHLLKCASVHLPVLIEAGAEKKQKNNVVKRYHDAAKETIAARLKLALTPDAVHKVYEDLNMEQAAEDEDTMTDAQFFKLLDQFEEAANLEAENAFQNVDDNVIDQDDEYQDCLELLNTYVERSKGAKAEMGQEPSTSKSGAKGRRGRQNKSITTEMETQSEGLEALTEYIPTLDPITKKAFKDPYVNRICQHVYEYQSILELIQGGKIKCPYSGCKNKRNLNINDLVKDENIAKKIAEKIQTEGDLD